VGVPRGTGACGFEEAPTSSEPSDRPPVGTGSAENGDPESLNRPNVDVLIATFNSGKSLEECLRSVREHVPVHRLIIVDRFSTDATRSIAERYGAEVHSEDTGIGLARTMAIALAETEFILFVDGDVVLRRPDFFDRAMAELQRPGTVAVVGGSVGHRFLFGMPFGMTLMRRGWARTIAVPPDAQGFETYYFRRAARRSHLVVRYVPDAMEHRSIYRVRNWPEWQGAQIRLNAGFSPYELTNAFAVILMIHLNTRRLRNVAYTPIFYLKLIRGFLAPDRFRYHDRRVSQPVDLVGSEA